MKLIDGTIIKFDKNNIKLKNFILNLFGEKNIQNIINKNSSEEIYKTIYDGINNKKFNSIYEKIVKRISIFLKNKNFYYQKIPSFRVHRINQKSVNYHTDIWYGHGENVMNVWVPLTETNSFNAIHISNIKDSTNLQKKFFREKLSIAKINNLAKKISKPQIVDYGNILLFNTKTFHGTHKNLSKKHRLSFDFRILLLNQSAGTKPIDEFYNKFNKKIKKKTKCLSYIYKRNFLMENLSHKVQREINFGYCLSNNLEFSLEETEIHGVDHYPNLLFYLDKKIYNHIVMTSILCLPNNLKLRNKLLNLSKKNHIELHFSLENKKLSDLKKNEINQYFEKLVKNRKLIL
tara:strand:- start:578 stop:1618 length:1041 start_codon:yes stop_codon:yes gene_type:complete